MLLFNNSLAAVRAGRLMLIFSVLCLGACLQAVHSYLIPHAGLLLSGLPWTNCMTGLLHLVSRLASTRAK